MKKIISNICLFFVVIFSFHNYSFSYELETTTYLIKYIKNKTEDTKKLQLKYNLQKDQKINNYLKKINEFEALLLKIQRTKSGKKFINKIVKQIKIHNDEIKIYLKKKTLLQKQKAHNYSILYSQKLSILTEKINTITLKIAKTLIKKDKLSTKDKQIINILYLIKNKLKNINSITRKKFYSRKNLNDYIISNITQMKNHFKQIRQIAK